MQSSHPAWAVNDKKQQKIRFVLAPVSEYT